MRIESISQVASLYKTTKTSAKYNVNAASYGRDYLSISQTGQDYQIAKQAVAEASDIREDKVAELKTSVQSGKYDVDSGDFASMLLAKYNEMKK